MNKEDKMGEDSPQYIGGTQYVRDESTSALT